MNNYINQAGLSALVLCALIAMSTFGYRMITNSINLTQSVGDIPTAMIVRLPSPPETTNLLADLDISFNNSFHKEYRRSDNQQSMELLHESTGSRGRPYTLPLANGIGLEMAQLSHPVE